MTSLEIKVQIRGGKIFFRGEDATDKVRSLIGDEATNEYLQTDEDYLIVDGLEIHVSRGGWNGDGTDDTPESRGDDYLDKVWIENRDVTQAALFFWDADYLIDQA